jgi:phosphoglycolate phosphatase-like HAD superfamily hydrolase
VVIVGDTPADVTCGKHLGVTAIGVATGHYSLQSLIAVGADYVFPDLTDTSAVIQAIL